MKKISGLMVAVILCVMLASSFVPGNEVQAFSASQLNYGEFTWLYSAKAGTSITFHTSLSTEEATALNITGWKAALCPADNKSLEAAVAVYDLTEENKYNDGDYAGIRLDTTLTQDIPSGSYIEVIFDETGVEKYASYYGAQTYVSESIVSFECDIMNNDGYAYAYVYADNIPMNADTYPTFYAADKTTAVTSFSDYATEKTDDGQLVHIYRLNILNAAEFDLSDENSGYLYYKVNSSNITPYRVNSEGLCFAQVYDLNKYIERTQRNITATNPFENKGATATIGDQVINVAVSDIKPSDNAVVQASINNIIDWTGKISSQPAEVVSILKQYASNITNVVAGGTLELTVPNGTDLSSGASVTFTNNQIAANVKAGDEIVVLHVKHDGSIEYLPATAGDGNITATFTSLSPVAWFKVEVENTVSTTNNQVVPFPTTSNLVSPKTGESFWDFLFH